MISLRAPCDGRRDDVMIDAYVINFYLVDNQLAYCCLPWDRRASLPSGLLLPVYVSLDRQTDKHREKVEVCLVPSTTCYRAFIIGAAD